MRTLTPPAVAPASTVELIDFGVFKDAIQRRFNEMKKGRIFRVQTEKDFLWQLYLDSFPPGTNPMFRERTEHDCSTCRAFVKNAGSMVAIVDGELTTIWDVQVGGQYQPVADALADYVKACAIENVYLYTESQIGVDKNFEETESGVRTWQHLHVTLPDEMRVRSADRGPREAEYRAMHDVVLRSLREISMDAIETVQDLISQNSLYRGAEKQSLVSTFAQMKRQFDELPEGLRQDYFAWSQVVGANAWACKIRNDVIGTLLVDISEGVDLEKAVKTFEDKVSGTNYKRPTALVTPKMKEQAKAKIEELGLMSALERRYARLEDIRITNVLFADRSAKTRMSGDVFDEIPTKGEVSPKNLGKVEEVTIEKFITDILPGAKSLEVLLENKHTGNLVSLIAPVDLTAKTMFKWDNPFSWSYNGDVADSIKERVKAAGGNVTGDVCCRLAWYNTDDLDLHMREPSGGHVYYGNKGPSPDGGRLDVDMNVTRLVRNPVENIFYGSSSKMRKGTYELSVNQFTKRESVDVGFDVEIDVLGNVSRFSHAQAVRLGQSVVVARIQVAEDGVKVVPVLPSSEAKRQVWGLDTQTFHPVTAVMLSPNFWDGKGVGNKHFFFMLDGCKNDGSARGFYNEFLSSELEPHRKTMEMVGARMRTEECDDQMSGLGFSSTQRNSLVVKVHGSFVRTVKILF